MAKSYLQNFLTRLPSKLSNLSARLLIQTGAIEGYHPLPNQQGKRPSQARLDTVLNHISDAELCLDIGCNTGFFAQALSNKGIFTIGFDTEPKNILVANAQYPRDNLLFKHLQLTNETARALPTADIILFLSVFHHLVKNFGQRQAEETLQTLTSRCRKQFFFETGQPDEKGTKFCDLMTFVDDIENWTNAFFIGRCGFSQCQCIGEFETFLTPVKRKLFLVSR
jgi:SAM-dependent methyltransferase